VACKQLNDRLRLQIEIALNQIAELLIEGSLSSAAD
jgi:hypothetical protein